MSKQSHTRGPWKVINPHKSTNYIVGPSVDNRMADTIPTLKVANLIASAPELLEALTKLWSATENGTVDKDFFELRETVRKALNKARGGKQ